jgi:hypothetical protein
MPYLGNTPSTSFATVVKDSFSGDGSTVAFTLSKVATTNSVSVFVENVRQEPTTAYAVSGTTLTFTAAPVSSSGNNIYVLHMNPTTTTTHPSAQNLTAVNGTLTGTLAVTGESTLTGDTTLSRSNQNGTVRLNLENTGAGGSTDYSEIKFNSTAGSTVTSIVQHRNNSGMNIGTTTDHPVSILQNNAAALTVNASGDIDVETGDIFFSSSGKGINLGVTSNTDANTLDDYEEGTWTPTNSGSNITYSTAAGHYTKIGRLVTASFRIIVASNSSSDGLHIINLPFNLVGANEYGGGFISYDNSSYTPLYIYGHDATFITAIARNSTLTGANLSGVQMQAMLVYYTAS